MLLIQVLRVFIQQDKGQSLQRRLLDSPSTESQSDYNRLVALVEKHKFSKRLTFEERLFLAKHYKSFQNERNGRTLKYMSAHKGDK